jgi:hypothetical protein
MTTKYEYKIQIIHEPSFEGFDYKYLADEPMTADELFDVLRHDLSIIVEDAEEIEFENCDGCAIELEWDRLIEDENAGLKFCSSCTEENRLGLKTEQEVSA